MKGLVDDSGTLLQDLGTTTRILAAFLASHADQLDRILTESERGIHHAANAAERADRLLAKAEGSWDPTVADVQSTLKILKDTSSSLKVLVDNLGAQGSVAGLLSSPATAKSTAETLENLQTASRNLKTVTQALESALK